MPAYLDGVIVTLEPGNHSALTNHTGEFVFSGIPAGVFVLSPMTSPDAYQNRPFTPKVMFVGLSRSCRTRFRRT